MNKAEARREAWWLIASVAQSAMDGGWPFNDERAVANGWVDAEGVATADGDRLSDAMHEVFDQAERRSVKRIPVMSR